MGEQLEYSLKHKLAYSGSLSLSFLICYPRFLRFACSMVEGVQIGIGCCCHFREPDKLASELAVCTTSVGVSKMVPGRDSIRFKSPLLTQLPSLMLKLNQARSKGQ